jgi:hypothetical protein
MLICRSPKDWTPTHRLNWQPEFFGLTRSEVPPPKQVRTVLGHRIGTQPRFAGLSPARERLPLWVRLTEVRQQIRTTSTGLIARLTARFAMPTRALLTRPHVSRGCSQYGAWLVPCCCGRSDGAAAEVSITACSFTKRQSASVCPTSASCHRIFVRAVLSPDAPSLNPPTRPSRVVKRMTAAQLWPWPLPKRPIRPPRSMDPARSCQT